jgi:hypothetical protein
MSLAKPHKDAVIGGELESLCPRCRRKTVHKILTLQGGEPRQVACLTCDYGHVLKAGDDPEPSGEPEAQAPVKPKAVRSRASGPAAPPDEPGEAGEEGGAAPAAKRPAAARAKAAPKPPQEPKPPKETKEAKEAREAKRQAHEEMELNKERWLDLKSRLGEAGAVEYSLSGDYGPDQILSHPSFGLGFVTKVLLPNKIEVQFEGFLKTLVMHVGKGK